MPIIIKDVLNSGFLPTLNGYRGANYNRDDSTIEFPGQVDENGIPRPDFEINKAEAQRYNAGTKFKLYSCLMV